MEVIADLHLHSKYSRATSKNLSFENLVKYARIKGLGLFGTGDFTHPTWFEEIKKLKEEKEGQGIYYYENFPFMITGEVSLMYTQEKGRRIHLVIFVPNVEVAEKINSWLDTKGRRDYDGRPIFKISCRDFTAKMHEIDERIEVIPAHIWTPYFGVYGSMSGFDSLKEAFGNQIDNIHAIETGLSSNPKMNWKMSELNNKAILSFSDAHSFWPWRIGREATIFEVEELNYQSIINSIRNNTIKATIEVNPAYGKYHWDGHRACKFSCSPEKTKELEGICPVCKRQLTIGVEYRVEKISDQEEGGNPNKKQYYELLPLHELIALAKASSLATQKTWRVYNQLIDKFGNEFNVLLKVSRSDLERGEVEDKLVNLILKNREGKIEVKPGFDGEYGEALLGEKQAKLF